MSLGNLAKERGVYDIICLGDLFHTNSTIHAEVLMAATCAVQRLQWEYGINFHCLVGNHDMTSKDGQIHSLHWVRSNGKLIDKATVFDIGDRKISALPYTENVQQLADFFKTSEELVLLHQGVNLNDNRGSAWVLNEIFTKEMVPDHVKRVLTGHYHKPIDDGKISIVGSPMQHTWSDYDDAARGCMILDLDTLETERIVNNYSPRFLKLDWIEDEYTYLPKNFFVKISNCPKDKMEHFREDILNDGAVSVEFEIAGNVEKKEVSPVFTSFDQIVQEYDEAVDGRRREVGRLLRDNMYETPKS